MQHIKRHGMFSWMSDVVAQVCCLAEKNGFTVGCNASIKGITNGYPHAASC
jgi:hypothetical protein